MIVLFFILILVIVIVGYIFSFQFIYNFIKPYLKAESDRKNLFKGMLIFAVVCVSFYLVVRFLAADPPFFNQAIEQLHKNEYVTSHVGDFASYSFNTDSLPKNPKDTAVFAVSLIGDSLTMNLMCTMHRIKNTNNWKLTKIKTDTITKTPEKDPL